jgi:CheY-like chemotaxis protein
MHCPSHADPNTYFNRHPQEPNAALKPSFSWYAVMKDKQSLKKNIVLADNDSTTSAALSILLEEIGVIVHKIGEKDDGKKIIKGHSFDMMIVDLDFPNYKGINLIHAFIQTHPKAEIIALCNKVTSAIYTRMRMLGVFRVLERPVKLQDIRDMLFRALASKRNVRMLTEKSNISLEIANHLQFLLTLSEQSFFEQILEICLSEGHEIDLAHSPEDFISMVQKGFYDVIFSSYEFLITMHPREMESIFCDPIKPVLFMVHPQKEVDLRKITPKFSNLVHLPPLPKKNIILDALQKNLPDYIQMRNKMYTSQAMADEDAKKGFKFFNPLSLAVNLFGKRIILFYALLIAIAALVGFLVNQMAEKKDESNKSEFIDNNALMLKELKEMNEHMKNK